MSKKLNEEKYLNIPTFVEAGESAAAKSETTGKMVKESYFKGMELLTGDGMTTSCETEVIIDPKLESARISLELATEDEIRAKLLKNLQTALVAECKNVVASLPVNDINALDKFVAVAVEKRAEFQDAKFKVHRLLVGRQEKFRGYLSDIFKIVLNKASEESFRNNYNEANKASKGEANDLIDNLISNMLDDEECKGSIRKLLNLILSEIKGILSKENFSEETNYFESKELNAEQFKEVVKVISNSEKKEVKERASIACAIKSARLIVPGEGIRIDGKFSAYRLIDIVGFTNDGLGSVNELINNAVLSKYNYDSIIYFASKRTVNKTHESFLLSIVKSMRPAKLIIVSTFMDKDAIFDEEEIPTMEMIKELNDGRKQELLDIVKKVATDDLHIILPTKEDIICISNKVNQRRHGEYAVAAYGADQYKCIRIALERAVDVTRKKISVGVNRTAQYLVPQNDVKQVIGQIVNQLRITIDREYRKLRDFSSQIHHWTLDAILWNMLAGGEHISDAKVWKNVHITTFSDMQRICLENLGEFKFSSDVKVGKKEDSIRIKKEFMANLQTQLYWVVRNLILKQPNNGKEESDCKKEIRRLGFMGKYNKWKIIDDLRLSLMKAVEQSDYLEKMLDTAISEALLTTYDKILY